MSLPNKTTPVPAAELKQHLKFLRMEDDIYVDEIDFFKLLLSLQSPLPNEQDVAISVCSILSSAAPENKKLRLDKCPLLLDALLGHVGFFSEESFQKIMKDTYVNGRGMDLEEFWNALAKQDPNYLRPLLCPCFGAFEEVVKSFKPKWRKIGSSTDCGGDMLGQQKKKPCTMSSCPLKENNNMDLSSVFFCPALLPTVGSKSEDKIGERIQQIFIILRNISFDECNYDIMANNSSLLRFLLFSASCSYGNFSQMALDTLGNIGGSFILQDVEVEDSISSRLLSLVNFGFISEDRFKLIRSLEIFQNLSKEKCNHKLMLSFAQKNGICRRVCELLTLIDIMLMVHALECLNTISGSGEGFCNELVQVPGIVSTLMSLLTFDPKCYGLEASSGMKVVARLIQQNNNSQTVSAGKYAKTSEASQKADDLLTSDPKSCTNNATECRKMKNVSNIFLSQRKHELPVSFKHASPYINPNPDSIRKKYSSFTNWVMNSLSSSNSSATTTSSTKFINIQDLNSSGINIVRPLTWNPNIDHQKINQPILLSLEPRNIAAIAQLPSTSIARPIVQNFYGNSNINYYYCEWVGCGFAFRSCYQVYYHAVAVHCHQVGLSHCEWGGNGCDKLERSRGSLMCHLELVHCTEAAFQLAFQFRKNRIEAPVPKVPACPTIKDAVLQLSNFYVGQTKNEFLPKDGPLTNSIRVTAALILQNLTLYSPIARRKLKAFESQLFNISGSNEDCSIIISQLIYYLGELDTSE